MTPTPPPGEPALREAVFQAVNYLTYLQSAADLVPAERERARELRDSLDRIALAARPATGDAVAWALGKLAALSAVAPEHARAIADIAGALAARPAPAATGERPVLCPVCGGQDRWCPHQAAPPAPASQPADRASGVDFVGVEERVRANPERADSTEAAKLVTDWFMAHVHESVAKLMDPDALGQLADTIAWALTARRACWCCVALRYATDEITALRAKLAERPDVGATQAASQVSEEALACDCPTDPITSSAPPDYKRIQDHYAFCIHHPRWRAALQANQGGRRDAH